MRVPSRTRVACATPAPATQAMTPMHNQRTATRFMGVMPAPRLIGRTPCMRFANRRYQTQECRWPDIARLEGEVSGKDLRDGRIVREPQLKRLYVARRHGASEVKLVGLAIAGVPDADLDAFAGWKPVTIRLPVAPLMFAEPWSNSMAAPRVSVCAVPEAGLVGRGVSKLQLDRLILNVCLSQCWRPRPAPSSPHWDPRCRRTSVMLLAEP